MIDRNALVQDLLKIYTVEQLAAESSDPEGYIQYADHWKLHGAKTHQEYLDLCDMTDEDFEEVRKLRSRKGRKRNG